MFVGELMCLFVYFLKKAINKHRGVGIVDPNGAEGIPASPGTQLAT